MVEALPNFLVTGQVAVVTGGAHGLGLATAKMLAAAGARVAIFDLDGDAAAAGAAAIGGDAHAVDVTDEAAVEAALGAIAARHGRLDILVNNAGIAVRGPAVDVAREDWERIVGVNLTGVFICARAAARHMLAQGSGAIVNVASIMGFSGGIVPNIAYQTTKGGVVNMTRALAIEWAPTIRVTGVAPTYVRTALTEKFLERPGIMDLVLANTPMKRLAEPEEVAAAILFLASPAAAMITGSVLPVDGGFLAR